MLRASKNCADFFFNESMKTYRNFQIVLEFLHEKNNQRNFENQKFSITSAIVMFRDCMPDFQRLFQQTENVNICVNCERLCLSIEIKLIELHILNIEQKNFFE